MSTLNDQLQQAIDGAMPAISAQIGADQEKTRTAVRGAVPLLLGALSRNAQRPQGAEALHNALKRDHDGSVLDSLGDLLGNPQAGGGDAILRHVLGAKQGAAEGALSQFAGLDKETVTKLLVLLAPMLLGMLGKKQRQEGSSPRDLPRILRGEEEAARRGGGGLGDLIGGVLGQGQKSGCLGLLGRLLGGRR
jgi:hypothetical protein